MHKTILVPIDVEDSEKGKPMIKIARRIGDEESRIILVHVIDNVPSSVVEELPEGTLEDARERVGKKLKAIANAAGIKPDVEVRFGSAYKAILDVAQEQEVDLIIVGSHKPGLQDYLLGSTAARVVRHAMCSVLVGR